MNMTPPSTFDRFPIVNSHEWICLRDRTRFIFVDGASASGKSTFKKKLMTDSRLPLSYTRRFTTRLVRPDDALNDDYVFISMKEFDERQRLGDFVEYVHYLFGMSYAIGKSLLSDAARSRPDVLSLMDLGQTQPLRTEFPNACIILIDAPIDSIRRRIVDRGYNTEEQVAERIANAEKLKAHSSEYDLVLMNCDGGFEPAYEQLVAFLISKGIGGPLC